MKLGKNGNSSVNQIQHSYLHIFLDSGLKGFKIDLKIDQMCKNTICEEDVEFEDPRKNDEVNFFIFKINYNVKTAVWRIRSIFLGSGSVDPVLKIRIRIRVT